MSGIYVRTFVILFTYILVAGSRIGAHFKSSRGSNTLDFSELSHMEDNKHRLQHWVESQHLEGWYTKLDLCIMSNTSNDTVKSIMNQCEAEAIARGEAHLLKQQPVRCRVGNSWPSKGEYCSSEDISFSDRKSLRKSIAGYDDPTLKPLKTFFSGIAKEKGALLLVGDSVMQQFYGAMACELEREGIWPDPSQFTNTDEMKYVHMPSGIEGSANYGVPIKFAPIYHFVNGRWDRVANASMHHLRKNVEDFIHAHDSVTVLINMGLHYVNNPVAHFTRQDYISQMTACLQYLNSVAEGGIKSNKKIRVLWRETSAQHFPTSNGYWPGVKYAAGMKLQCQPIADTTPTADWRNSDINTILHEHNLKNIQVVPFYNITLPLWTMHVNGHLRDCTHFCWSPMLYQSLFHALALPFAT